MKTIARALLGVLVGLALPAAQASAAASLEGAGQAPAPYAVTTGPSVEQAHGQGGLTVQVATPSPYYSTPWGFGYDPDPFDTSYGGGYYTYSTPNYPYDSYFNPYGSQTVCTPTWNGGLYCLPSPPPQYYSYGPSYYGYGSDYYYGPSVGFGFGFYSGFGPGFVGGHHHHRGDGDFDRDDRFANGFHGDTHAHGVPSAPHASAPPAAAPPAAPPTAPPAPPPAPAAPPAAGSHSASSRFNR